MLKFSCSDILLIRSLGRSISESFAFAFAFALLIQFTLSTLTVTQQASQRLTSVARVHF